MPISPNSETGMSPSSSESKASGGGVESQGVAIIAEATQQEGIPSQIPDLLSQSELTLIFMKSCFCKNTSVHLTRSLFSEQVRVASNVSGQKKQQLDPMIISYIKSIVFKYFPSLHDDITKEWKTV